MTSPSSAPRSLLSAPGPALEDESAHPLWSIGFRPFFLLASLSATLLVPLWLMWLGGADAPGYFPPRVLHAHEMLFGFTAAVIAGFLLTAAANWTRQPTTRARSLMLLSLLWLLGRVLLFAPAVPQWLVVLTDLSFLPAVALSVGAVIVRTENWRNLPFLGILAILTLGNGLMHAEGWGTPGTFGELIRPGLGKTIALRAVSLILIVMGGRVIPMFTRNAGGAAAITPHEPTDRAALFAFGLAALADLIAPGSSWSGVLWFAAGALHVLRMRTWGTWSARAPLLWILHAGYFCVAGSFLLEGAAVWHWAPLSSAQHLLTVGGIGGLCLGMMTRVSLGHSGRMLVAPRSMTVAFALWAAATFVRVVGPLIPELNSTGIYHASGTTWTLAYLLLLRFGVPIWFRPRADRV